MYSSLLVVGDRPVYTLLQEFIIYTLTIYIMNSWLLVEKKNDHPQEYESIIPLFGLLKATWFMLFTSTIREVV